MRHVVVMTATGSVGLMAVFVVDFANLFYISLLGKQELAAAIGYAGTLLFFTISITIGISIATAALVSRALGAGDRKRARRLAMSCLTFMAVVSILFVCLMLPFLRPLLSALGATGETHEIARVFLMIVVPTMPLMGVGMAAASVLRATGDARRSMYVTLSGGAVSAVLDPILIFGFDLGVNGAAIATVCARIMIVSVGFYGAIKVHRMVASFNLRHAAEDSGKVAAIALPAILTNIATPVGNFYLTYAIGRYGDDAVAGWAVIGRLIPIAFGGLFALSGSVGPIIGQNFGAGNRERVRQTLTDALKFMAAYTLTAWLILFALRNVIVTVFHAEGGAGDLIAFFCTFVAVSFLFNGMLFVSNAAYNTLGKPFWSTFFNWTRATAGTIPFVYLGSLWFGAEGVLAGWGLGGVLFGIAAIWACYRLIDRIPHRPPDGPPPPPVRTAQSAFTSGKGATAG